MRQRLHFVVIGAQKSASTTLHRALRAHPSVYSPREEVPVFEVPNYSRSAVDSLDSRLSKSPRTSTIGIKRPTYLCLPEVPSNLAAEAPEARLLAILRNPVQRAVSAYYHYVRFGHLPPEDHETGLRMLLSGGYSNQRGAEVLTFGLYGAGVQRWLAHYSLRHLKLFRQEDFIQTYNDSMAEAYDFLDLEATSPPPLAKSMEGAYHPARLRLWRTLHPLLFRPAPEERIEERSWILSRSFGFIDSRLLSRLLPGVRPRLSQTLRDDLRQYYALDQQLLTSLTGMDTASWQ